MNKVELETTDLTADEIADLAATGVVVLTRHGKPLAVVSALSGTDWESLALAKDPQFVALIEDSRRSYAEHGGVGIDDVREQLGLTKGPRAKRTMTKKSRR
ncbi:MAG: hypothetical protein HYR84_07685 [Planctomycetes bacterium]|nr:hypothetical protein [Planctomycetota bacterium]